MSEIQSKSKQIQTIRATLKELAAAQVADKQAEKSLSGPDRHYSKTCRRLPRRERIRGLHMALNILRGCDPWLGETQNCQGAFYAVLKASVELNRIGETLTNEACRNLRARQPLPDQPWEPQKLYMITRADLSPAQQAVQAAHSLANWVRAFPEAAARWAQDNVLVLLSVNHEEELTKTLANLEDPSIQLQAFREPDLGNSLTAITASPSARMRLGRLTLALQP